MTTTPIPTGPTGPTGPAGTGPSKLLVALIVIGGVLLIAVVAVIFLLIGQSTGSSNAGSQTPLPTASESASADATPTPETTDGGGDSGGGQPPADNSPHFTSFNADPQVACDPDADEKAQPQISWTAANASSVYWTPNDAVATPDNGYKVPSSGNQDDMSASKGAGERYEFPCAHRNTFDTTITIYGTNGQTVSKHVTFTDINSAAGDGN